MKKQAIMTLCRPIQEFSHFQSMLRQNVLFICMAQS